MIITTIYSFIVTIRPNIFPPLLTTNEYLNRRLVSDSVHTSGWRHVRHNGHDWRHSAQTLEVCHFRENRQRDRCYGLEDVSCVNLHQKHDQIPSRLAMINKRTCYQQHRIMNTKEILTCAPPGHPDPAGGAYSAPQPSLLVTRGSLRLAGNYTWRTPEKNLVRLSKMTRSVLACLCMRRWKSRHNRLTHI